MRLYRTGPSDREKLQSRLMTLAAVFLFLYSAALTLAPVVYQHSWDVTLRSSHWTGYLAWLAGFALLQRRVQARLPHSDPYLLPAAALLTGWGLLTIWRLSAPFGARQTLWLIVGLLACLVILRVPNPLAALRRYKYLWLTGGLLLAALTFVFGTYPGGLGPHLWLGFAGVYLQPSEPLKLLLVAFLAAYLADRIPLNNSLLQLITPALVLVGAALAILVVQRDLGTASLFLLLFTVVVYLATGKRRMLVISAVSLLGAAALGYGLFDVIRLRMEAWLNPWLDPSGRSYQIVQSLLAVAAGGVFGQGPGLGSPSVVPVAHSDFIFAAIAEESGLVGTLALLGLIGLIAVRGLAAALHTDNRFHRFLAGGLAIYLSAQSILIIGGNLRLLPLTGVTLPFISYGGSSLLTCMLALLALLLISNQSSDEPTGARNPTPFLVVGAGISLALVALALVNGYWAFVRSDELLTRTDNPRRAITDRYVRRGAILDRRNTPLATTTGDPGTLQRIIAYPALSPVVGYTSATYGQSGLEQALDPYLRGLQGLPASTIWMNHLLYGQTPPGLDVRLSLDLRLQQKADDLLAEHTGAIVMVNARTGEILVMSSHPTFNANQVDEFGAAWQSDPAAPLLNRAAQGSYPVGTAIGPFILARALASGSLPDTPNQFSYVYENHFEDCALPLTSSRGWGDGIQAGCPGALIDINNQLSSTALNDLYTRLGLYQTLDFPLPTAPAASLSSWNNAVQALLGFSGPTATPLHMALAAASLSNGKGVRPQPWIALAVQTPEQGWVVLPGGSTRSALSIEAAAEASRLLAAGPSPYWETTGRSYDRANPVSWYLAGSIPPAETLDWQGNAFALALVLEENDPRLAQSIGRQLMQTAQQP